MVNVSTSQPLDRGFKHHTGHDHDASYVTMASIKAMVRPTYWLVPCTKRT